MFIEEAWLSDDIRNGGISKATRVVWTSSTAIAGLGWKGIFTE
jgi:hypothetical protein